MGGGQTGQGLDDRDKRHRLGRVVALAAFLGVGAVITGLPAVATADSGAAGERAVATDTTDAGPAAGPRQSRGARGGFGGAIRSSTMSDRRVNAERASASIPVPGVSDIKMSTARASINSAAVRQYSPSVVAGVGINSATGPSGTGNPVAPVVAPLRWATPAVSRREFSAAARTAAAVSVGTTATPAAATVDDSPLADLLGQPGANSAILTAAKQFALTVINGRNGAVALQSGLQGLDADPLFQNFSWNAVLTDPGLSRALGGAVRSVVTGLAADTEVQAAIGGRVNGYINSALGNTPIAIGIAATVARAVVGLLADPAAGGSLAAIAGSAVTSFLNQPGVSTAAVDAADEISALVAGDNPNAGLYAVWRSLVADQAVSAAVGVTLTDAADAILTNANLLQSVGAAVSDVVAGVAGNSALRTRVGEQVARFVREALADSLAAAEIAGAVSDAVVSLMADPSLSGALAGAAGSILADFLSKPGVVTAVANVAGQFAVTLFTGAEPSVALEAAWQGLQADSAITAASPIAVGDAVTSALNGPGLVSALGATATAVVTVLTADPAATALVSDLVGSTAYGNPIIGMLADPSSSVRLAEVAGLAVTGFLGVPGVVGALADTAQQITSALLAGVAVSDALQSALDAVQADPAITTAVDATLSGALRSILSETAVQDAVGQVAAEVVVTLISGSGDTSNLSPAAGQATEAAVDSLLANTAVQNLISDLAVDIAGGTQGSDSANTVIQAVVDAPVLQVAVGVAVGEAVGSLFGDNPVGFLVSQVVGAAAATLLIGVASGLASLFNLFGFTMPGAAAVSLPFGSSYAIDVGRSPALSV